MMLKQAEEAIRPHYRRGKAGGVEKKDREGKEKQSERQKKVLICLNSYSCDI